MFTYMFNYQWAAASGLVMAVPPLAGMADISGMFWITSLIDGDWPAVDDRCPLCTTPSATTSNHQPRLLHVKGMEGETVGINALADVGEEAFGRPISA